MLEGLHSAGSPGLTVFTAMAMEADLVRGSIEVAQRTRVAGWIYASAETVRDKTILAFVDGRCVGSGKVEKFRRDLLEAKLGDGYCGFDFPIRLQDEERLGSVIVKLQNADATLIQQTSRIVGTGEEDEDAATDLGAIAPASVSWMQDRGWLEQHEFDFLKAVQSIGGYERGLRQARRAGDAAALIKPEVIVRDLLGIYSLGEVEILRTHVASISDLADLKSELRRAPISVAALWSEDRCRISLDERSHTGPVSGRGQVLTEAPSGGIDYSFGPDRVLFIHRDCSFGPHGPSPAPGVILYTASPKAQAVNLATRRSQAA